METISPGDMAPLAPLAALVTPVMVGRGAVTLRVTLTMVVPVAGLVPATVMVPVYGPGTSVLSTAGTTEAVRLNVPVLGVVPEVGETWKTAEPLADAVKAAADPPPDTWMAAVGLVPPTR